MITTIKTDYTDDNEVVIARFLLGNRGNPTGDSSLRSEQGLLHGACPERDCFLRRYVAVAMTNARDSQ